jgi:hypothetical protein
VDVDAPQTQPSWPSPVLDPLPPPLPAFTDSPAPDLYIIGAPSLPPAPEANAHEPEDLQMPIITRAYEHSAHHGPELVGTGATRVLAAAGWLGSAVGYTVAAIALSKSYRHITSDNWRDAFDHIHWLLPLMISSFGMAYLGWVVWATLAAVNGHRVAPLASSPWLPPFAYLVGPIAAAVVSIYKPEWNGALVASAVVWVCLWHGFVLVSLRSSARRIGADADQFTRLIWFPLASVGYRVIATVALPTTSFNNTALFAVLVAIDVTLMLATAISVWRAMHSFDMACARDRYRSVENQLPAFMASAHR